MKKHKKRFIIPIILLLLMILLIWGSCRKTKALEDSVYANSTFNITASDSNSGAIFYYIPTNFLDAQDDLLQINYTATLSSGWIRLLKYSDSAGDGLYLYFKGNNDPLVEMSGLSFRNYKNSLCYFYIVIGNSYDQNSYQLAINYGFVYYDGTTFNDVNAYCYFSNIASQYYDDINEAYMSSNGLSINAYYYNSIYNFDGAINGYIYDVLDYSDTFSEYVDDVKSDYLSKADSACFSNIYTNGYNAGYIAGQNAGYQSGLDDGYADGYNAGQTAGYNSGYTAGQGDGYRSGYDTGYDDGYDAGLTAGYNNGYADGLADNAAGQELAFQRGYDDGAHDGYITGYDRGYDLGYDDGYANGMSGATPASQAVTLIGSIFGGVGRVLSIQLFPGVTLGLLILVPLFFAVLGLILWIWRRN